MLCPQARRTQNQAHPLFKVQWRELFALTVPSVPLQNNLPDPKNFSPCKNPEPKRIAGAQAIVAEISDGFWTGRTVASIPTPQGPVDTISSAIYGIHSGQHVPSGGFGLYHKCREMDAAWKRNDKKGMIGAGLGITAYSSQTAIGVSMTGLRGVTIASMASPTTTGLVTALTLLAKTVNILFCIVYGLFGICFLYENHRARAFYRSHVENGTFQSLQKAVFVPLGTIVQLIDKEKENLRVKGEAALKKAACVSRSSEDLDSVLRNEYFQKKYPELAVLKEQYLSKLDESLLADWDLPAVLGLLLKLREMQLTNEAAVEQAVGSGCLEKIKKAAARGLEARLQSSVPAVQKRAREEESKLFTEIKTHFAENIKLRRLIAIMGVAGAIIGGLVFLTGPQAIVFVVLGLTLALALYCNYVNYCVQKGAFNGQPGSWDKKLIQFLVLFLVASIAASIAICVLFHGSWLALAVLLAFSLIALYIYWNAYNRAAVQEQKWREEHPTIQDFAKHLEKRVHQTERVDKETLSLFKKLPKDTRVKITNASVDQDSDRYADFENHDQLGKEFLHYYFRIAKKHLKLEPIEVQQLSRAAKKTAKLLWIQSWYANENAFIGKHSVAELMEKQALHLEALREGILNKDYRLAKRAYDRIDKRVRDILHKNIGKVLKREESFASLSRAVQTVMHAS